MGLIYNTIERWELEEGDHIYVWKKIWMYAHHGIYIGDDMVIHYGADTKFHISNCGKCYGYLEKLIGRKGKHDTKVNVSCLDCFLEGGTLKRFDYSVSQVRFLIHRDMTCSTEACYPPQKVKETAIGILKEGFGDDDIVVNNCEDFAYFCKTGKLPNKQMKGAVKLAVAATSAVAIAGTAGHTYKKYRENRRPEIKSKHRDSQ